MGTPRGFDPVTYSPLEIAIQVQFIKSRFHNRINSYMETGKKKRRTMRFVAMISLLVLVAATSGCVYVGGVTRDSGSQSQSNSTETKDTGAMPDSTDLVTPFLMFQGKKAQEAIDFYIDVIPDSKIEEVQHWGDMNPQFSDGIMMATVTIGGQKVVVSDSPITHAFDFTPSFSFLLECDSEEELESLAGTLEEDGEVLMPIGDYGFSQKFTFVVDRFGVSWQLVYW